MIIGIIDIIIGAALVIFAFVLNDKGEKKAIALLYLIGGSGLVVLGAATLTVKIIFSLFT